MKMRLWLKWLTPILLRLLSQSHVSLASLAELQDPPSLHLVTGFSLGLAVHPQPRADLSLDSPATFIQLTNHQLDIPIMPLHLLGKKSWNVYNQDNIAKVKRDEAAAKAREEAEEERMQEVDAERRIQILRGERPALLPAIEAPKNDLEQDCSPSAGERERKKRKRFGEDDTDFELRVARDQTKPSQIPLVALRNPTLDAPLTDRAGHISLFPLAPPRAPAAKNPDAEQEAVRKRKEYGDQYTMRFANAAGSKEGLDRPWYSQPSAADPPPDGGGDATDALSIGTDVWGNADPGRKRREAERLAAGDPLAAMRRGAAQVRQTERDRKRWQEERDREMVELLRAEQERDVGRERRKRRRREDDNIGDGGSGARSDDELEGFGLDKREATSSPSSRRQMHSKERRSGHRDSHRRSHRERRERGRSQDRDRHRYGDRDRHGHHRRHE